MRTQCAVSQQLAKSAARRRRHLGWARSVPLRPVERADRSYVVTEFEVEIWKFSLIRAGVVDLGKMTSPR